MEYGSTPYVGMASPLNVYKMTCSELCCRCNLARPNMNPTSYSQRVVNTTVVTCLQAQ